MMAVALCDSRPDTFFLYKIKPFGHGQQKQTAADAVILTQN